MLIVDELGYEVRLEVVPEIVWERIIFNGTRN